MVAKFSRARDILAPGRTLNFIGRIEYAQGRNISIIACLLQPFIDGFSARTAHETIAAITGSPFGKQRLEAGDGHL